MKKYIPIIGFALLLGVVSHLYAGPSTTVYVITYRMSFMQGAVTLNGVPIVSEKEKKGISGQLEVQNYIMPGENKLDIRGIKMTHPAAAAYPLLNVTIYRAKRGTMPNEGEKVASFEWEGKDGAEALPFKKEILFNLTDAPPSELWTTADVLSLTAADKKQIQVLMQEFHTACQKRDTKKFIAMTSFSLAEMARISGNNFEEMQGAMAKALPEMLKELGGNKLAKVDVKSLQYRLILGNRVVMVLTKDGKEPIGDKKGEITIPFNVSRIGGKWMMSR